jgi:ATP phosphoribosyltransferase
MLTWRFFMAKGVVSYHTVESLGATEGAPAAGSAEAIVDITTTGATLKANGLRILSDGLILQSQAVLVSSKVASRPGSIERLEASLAARLSGSLPPRE